MYDKVKSGFARSSVIPTPKQIQGYLKAEHGVEISYNEARTFQRKLKRDAGTDPAVKRPTRMRQARVHGR